MRYWLQPRYTITRERLKWIYFHRRQRALSLGRRMEIGDRVVLYETASLPGGSMSVLALLRVAGRMEELAPGDASRYGGVVWDFIRPAKVDLAVPLDQKHLGVPLSEVRRIMGWSERAAIRQLMEIAEGQYARIAAALRDRIEGVTR